MLVRKVSCEGEEAVVGGKTKGNGVVVVEVGVEILNG